MAEVECTLTEIELAGDGGVTVPSVCLTCTACLHQVEIFGRRGRSVRRALVTMKEECPRRGNLRESNFYVADREVDD